MSQEELMSDFDYERMTRDENVFPPLPPLPPGVGRTPEQAETERKARKSKEDVWRKKIKTLLAKHPKLVIRTDDKLGEQLEDLTEDELEVAYNNLLFDINSDPKPSAVEAGLLKTWSAGINSLIGVDISEELLADPQATMELRDMTGGYAASIPSWLSFLARSSALIAKGFTPSLSFLNHVGTESPNPPIPPPSQRPLEEREDDPHGEDGAF